MSEIVLAAKPTLSHAQLGRPGGTLCLSALPEGRLIHVLQSPSADRDALAERLATLGGPSPHAIRAYAPGQWFVVGRTPLGTGEFRHIAEALGRDAAVCDQSHGRIRLALEGTAATQVLAKGCALDLADAAFPVGRSAQCLFGHLGVHVTRIASDAFELIVLRSFAQSLWDEMAQAGAEFG